MNRRTSFRILVAVAMMALAAPAAAHPLGNFTVNQHVGLSGRPDGVAVTYVLDMAEIPAARELAAMGGEPELAERAGPWCDSALQEVEISVDGTGVPIAAESAVLSKPEGEAGLPTLRLECVGTIATPLPADISIVNANRSGQLGWREIVIDPSIIGTTELPRQSPSQTLSTYPADGPLLEVSSGSVLASGTTSAAPTSSDSVARQATGIPRVIEQTLEATGGFGLVAVAAAFALGAGHALAPGHGKTLMAASLLARNGTARHAVGLGLATAVSHTIGVAALGAMTLVASSTFSPERVYPLLSLLSALTIAALGAGMAIRALRRRTAHGHHHHGNDDAHDHGHHHPHDHHDHDHGAHDHDAPGSAVGWRTMAALGLAGGMVPSASAVVLLLAAVRYGRPVLGLILVGLFGLGMSTVLVVAGLSVLSARGIARRRAGGAWHLVTRLQPLAGVAVAIGGVALSIGAIQSL